MGIRTEESQAVFYWSIWLYLQGILCTISLTCGQPLLALLLIFPLQRVCGKSFSSSCELTSVLLGLLAGVMVSALLLYSRVGESGLLVGP